MDKETFASQALALEKPLYAVARTYLRRDADLCDAVQQALLRAWEKLPTLRNDERFKPWLTRILINECQMVLRRQKRVVLVEQPEESAAPQSPPPLLACIRALPEKYRLPIVLYHVEGYTVKEVADVLRLPYGTVTSRLKRGREMLKVTLKEAILDEA